MANYGDNNLLATTPTLQAVSSTYKTMIQLLAATTGLKRNKWFDIIVSMSGTPADQNMEWDVARATAVATGVASVPVALDPADAACSATAIINATGEGTVTANSTLLYMPGNIRATLRWVAAPGSELVGPATNAAGLSLRTRSGSGYTGNAGCSIIFSE